MSAALIVTYLISPEFKGPISLLCSCKVPGSVSVIFLKGEVLSRLKESVSFLMINLDSGFSSIQVELNSTSLKDGLYVRKMLDFRDRL